MAPDLEKKPGIFMKALLRTVVYTALSFFFWFTFSILGILFVFLVMFLTRNNASVTMGMGWMPVIIFVPVVMVPAAFTAAVVLGRKICGGRT
jgi:hypothetical protein